MADLDQLERALIKADAAGDTAAARALAAEIRRYRQDQPAPAQEKPAIIGKAGLNDALREVLQSTDWGTRNIAGAGTAMSNLWEGIKQRIGMGDPERIAQNRVIAEEAPVGAIAGNVATYAPLAMVPGANTIAGGAALGAATGALQPTMPGESVAQNMAIAGVAGGAVPAAIRAGKTIKAAVVDPFTEAGRTRIAGGVLNRAAADPAAVAQRLQTAQGATPGFHPTVGQAADDAGMAALERSVRAVDPRAFASVEQEQRAALADALRTMAGDPAKRQALVDAREQAAESLYGKAFQSDAMRRQLAQDSLAHRSMTAASGIHQGAPMAAESLADDLATPGLRALASRPMFQDAIAQAKTLAANKGVRLDDPLQSLEGLHYIKLALDDMANPGAASSLGRNANAAVNSMRSQLADELAVVSPTYGNARKSFADLSKPINQMDISQNLLERFVPALYRDMPAPAQLNAQALTKALTDSGDDIAKSVTGMKGATLQGTMDPGQMQTLQSIVSDAQAMKLLDNLGRGAGSDTVQKLAMSHLAAEAGIPNWMASVARVPGGWAKRAGDIFYGDSDAAVRQQLARLMQNPQEAASAMNAAGATPSQLADLLQLMAVGAGQSAGPAMLSAQ